MVMKHSVDRILFYTKKTNAFVSQRPYERNSFRGERLTQYKEALNKRLREELK